MSTYTFEDDFNSDFADSYGYESPEFSLKYSDLTGKQHLAGENEFEHKFKQRLLYAEKIPQPLTKNTPENKFEGIGDRLKYYFSGSGVSGSGVSGGVSNISGTEQFATIPNWYILANKIIGENRKDLIIRIVIILYILLIVMNLFIMKDINELKIEIKVLNAKIK